MCFINSVMSILQTHFGRQELGHRADLDDDTLRYWIRAGLLRAEHGGGGKGRHRRFTRLELGLAVLLARLRALGFSSSALVTLSERFHAAVDWMGAHRLDAEQVMQVQELLELRARVEEAARADPPGDENTSWRHALERKTSDPWFDLPPSAIRLAKRLSIEEWQQHYIFFQVLTDIALLRPTDATRPIRLTRDRDGRWRLIGAEEAVDSVELHIDALASQLWSGELREDVAQ